MDGGKRKFFKKHQTNQFKRKGVKKKGKWSTSSNEQSSGISPPADTVYRILCPLRKIGNVIGKGGNIVKTIREDTQAKISISDSLPGSDERIIIIYSSPEKISRKQNDDEDSDVENEQEIMEPHCAAQEALLRVHDRIVEEDLFGGMASDDDNEDNVVTARLLVPNNMVGCLLGKGGDIIQRLRSETGANIRVLAADNLPSCAMSTDELVQISAKPEVAKKALFEVSTLLHLNPRKDKPPSAPLPYHHPGGSKTNMIPPANPMWSRRSSNSHSMPPMPWAGGRGNHPSGFEPGGFNGVPPGHGVEQSAEFSMKILCSLGKIGGVIGKGGSIVKLLEQETGASIHVGDIIPESDERAIRVSAFEAISNPRSQTIDAILQLQNKTSEFFEKGTITTRLLVPSGKVGCILGQGGHVINEMRRRTQADIRVCPKDDKPKCASEDEELVQISGNFSVAKDALAEIASRLRVRYLRDSSAGPEPRPVEPVPGRSFSSRGLPLAATTGASISGGYDSYERLRGGGYDYEHQGYSVPPAATGYLKVNNALDGDISSSGVNSAMGTVGKNIPNFAEVAGARVKLQDPHSGGSEVLVDIRGSSDHLNTAQSILQSYMTSARHDMNPPQVAYHSIVTSQQSSYQDMNPQQVNYQNPNAQQSPYDYQDVNPVQSSYSLTAQQGVYANATAPQGAYHIGSQQGAYQY